VAAFRRADLTLEDELRWFFVACHAAHDLWDDEAWYALSGRHLQLARDVGALSLLPAADAVERLARTTRPSGTPWGLGIEARSRALVSEGEAAEFLYREAIDRLGQCRGAVALARAHLVYGEWLRRENRRADARAQLRTAYDMFARIGAEAFAERARGELLATGESIRKRAADVPDELTAQERQIARRARDGQSNSEIGAELFLSPRTVEWHLGKVFTKLGISSRRQLRKALPDPGHASLRT
jgi:DNA-binding CsgD family transcriptional regulator